MAKKLYEEASVQNIANAIRNKSGSSKKYKVAEMAEAIRSSINTADGLTTYSQVRAEVQNFLDNVTYDSSDYTVSSIADYVTNTTNNYCAGCKVNIKQAGKLIVCDGGNGGVITTDSLAGDNYIYNLTPNMISTYVNIVDDKVVQCGTIKPSGSLRMIKSGEAVNARDLGGWACDGGSVKYGKLFRGGQCTEADITVLYDFLRIKHELNLRYANEITSYTSPLGAAVEFTHIDGAWYTLADKAKIKAMFDCIYECVLKDEALYYHCASGADRTGTLSLLILAVLGVSQSDIDKDYELTSFYTGVSNDAAARRRNEAEWTGLINELNAYSGDTLRDKTVNYLLSAGVSVNVINTIRHGLINGDVEDVVAEIAAITNNLTNATSDNTGVSVEKGGSYTETITADDDYTLDGATVTVTMNDVEITSTAYSNGIISISNVTGDIVITVVAKKASVTNILTSSFIHNDISYEAIGYEDNARLSISSGSTTSATDRVVIGYCPVSSGDIIRVKGLTYPDTNDDGTVAIVRYNSSKTFVSANRLNSTNTAPLNGISCSFDDNLLTITINSIDGFIRLCGIGSTGKDCVVTINEEIS